MDISCNASSRFGAGRSITARLLVTNITLDARQYRPTSVFVRRSMLPMYTIVQKYEFYLISKIRLSISALESEKESFYDD